MTVPRNYLMRYCVIGYKSVKGNMIQHKEMFNNGRDAYIMETYLKREGYTGVKIIITWLKASFGKLFLL